MSFFSDSAPSINNDTGQPANNLFQQRLQRIKKTDKREDSSHWEQSFLGDNPIGTVMEKIFPDSESDIRTEQSNKLPIQSWSHEIRHHSMLLILQNLG